MDEEDKIKTYDDGVRAGKKQTEKKMQNKECLDLYKEGYKSGFRDGYKAAQEEFRERMLTQMPPEIRKQIDEGAQPAGWPFIW